VGLLDDEELGAYAQRLAEHGDRVSLAMTLLKLTSPGVPDIYQGDELPFLALVDPDNRRQVDWELRRRLLASGEPPPKLDLIRRTLKLRERRPAAFASTYDPVDAGADVCTFLRGGEVLVAVAVRGDLSALRQPSGTWDEVYRTPHLLLAERSK
jgi:(1->4)-alpha-D-glucan 1-alpha-D-glucosylmutase